ncbi:MAG TPA: DUF58 domain-containing protein [Blastocatellia bacterium]|nr:DUF58 domain-containing protein [Blastocatellia bacterium]
MLFDEEFLKKLERLSIVSKRVFAGQMRAERRSRKRGSGLEFADFKQYLPGDDFRSLDWNAFVRLDKLLLKLYEEEEDLPIYFFIDSSRSMTIGKPSKFDYARRLVAALSYISLSHLDRVSLVPFSTNIEDDLPRVRGKTQIHRMLRFLEDIKAHGQTDLRQVARTFLNGSHRRGLVVVVSDLFDDQGYEDALNMISSQRHEVFVLQISDSTEAHPPLMGELRLIDAESGEMRELTVTPNLLRAYEQAYKVFCEKLETFCLQRQIGVLRVETSQDLEDLILNVFRQGRFVA